MTPQEYACMPGEQCQLQVQGRLLEDYFPQYTFFFVIHLITSEEPIWTVESALQVLNSKPRYPDTSPRMICEVKNGIIAADPNVLLHFMLENVAEGQIVNSFWTDQDDIIQLQARCRTAAHDYTATVQNNATIQQQFHRLAVYLPRVDELTGRFASCSLGPSLNLRTGAYDIFLSDSNTPSAMLAATSALQVLRVRTQFVTAMGPTTLCATRLPPSYFAEEPTLNTLRKSVTTVSKFRVGAAQLSSQKGFGAGAPFGTVRVTKARVNTGLWILEGARDAGSKPEFFCVEG